MATHGSPVFANVANRYGGRSGMLDAGDVDILEAFRRLAVGHSGEGHGFSHLNNHRACSAYWMRCLCGVEVSLDGETVRKEAARGVESVTVLVAREVEFDIHEHELVVECGVETLARIRTWHGLQMGGHDHALHCNACGWRRNSTHYNTPTLAVIEAYMATQNIEAG